MINYCSVYGSVQLLLLLPFSTSLPCPKSLLLLLLILQLLLPLQTEVATERVTGIEQRATLWNVEEHRAPKKQEAGDQEGSETKEKKEPARSEDLFGFEVMTLSEKMYELQMKMITTIHDIPQGADRYESSPHVLFAGRTELQWAWGRK